MAMGRLVQAVHSDSDFGALGGASEATAPYAERVAKYVPAEIVAGYLSVVKIVELASKPIPNSKLLEATHPAAPTLAWLAFVAGAVATPIYLNAVGRPLPEQRFQLWIATASFLLWGYVLGGPFRFEGCWIPYDDLVGGFLVMMFTWLAGLVVPRKEPAASPT